MKIQTNKDSNISVQEVKALKQLSDNHSITIKPADKGGNIVLLDNDKYTLMCYKILKNQDWYRRITGDIIEKYNKEFYPLIDTTFLNGTITKTTWDFIRTKFP